jgi:hypothetical protein
MSRFFRGLLIGCLAIALLVVAAGFYGYRSLQQVPEFYARALAKPAAEPAKAAYKFEQEVLELNNDVRREGNWQATFTAEEINGWLASDLPIKFPKALPSHVSDPRVAITREMIQVACKYSDSRFNSVISIGAQPQMTAEPNVIAIRIKQVRAGALPVPLANLLEQISQHTAQAGLPLRWGEEAGDPVAYITLPLNQPAFQGKTLRVESVELQEGALVVTGKTAGG